MLNPDDIWRQIVASKGKDKELIDSLHTALVENIKLSQLSVIIKYVKKLTKEEKSIRILDYGCGGGRLITYLRILGYKNLNGVDVKSQKEMSNLNAIHNNMGFDCDVFFTYDGNTLPFDDTSFDVIVSQQVLEHVKDVEKYFSECKRILSPKGKILLDFPHRLVPFDTHTRMWFVHYLPVKIRGYFYNKYRDNRADYYSMTLNLKYMSFYNDILNDMFSSTLNMTGDRIKNFTYQDNYEGNIKLRIFLDRLINLPLIGVYITKIISIFANTTLIVTK